MEYQECGGWGRNQACGADAQAGLSGQVPTASFLSAVIPFTQTAFATLRDDLKRKAVVCGYEGSVSVDLQNGLGLRDLDRQVLRRGEAGFAHLAGLRARLEGAVHLLSPSGKGAPAGSAVFAASATAYRIERGAC